MKKTIFVVPADVNGDITVCVIVLGFRADSTEEKASMSFNFITPRQKKATIASGNLLAAALLTAMGTTALAVGPDVIVGDLPDVSNWTSSAPVNGKRAYSVGTVSCNIGTVQLKWISSTNQHPVISGNMYRIKDGRFEQIGQSWLKHGFTALQGTVCDPCTTPWPNGTHLAVGCSDPYSSGLNGSQGGLGPKSEVNAYTGFFPYPYTPASTVDALSKRLVVNESDLDPATGRYFVASMYIAPDDATTGNGLNNQSYRLINVAASNKNISLTGTTQRGRAAIYAWRDHGLGTNQVDPEVVIANADVPNEGRFIVAHKVYPVGPGQYRYEYAVQNFNSHLSGQSFSIPVPAGAVITNTGFHDVDYHSGEPYSGTDWSVTNSSGTLTWQTQTFAQNPNANALRYDTIYNFWFDCNFPPAPGNATLGLFRTGDVPSISMGVSVPSPDGIYRPINDNCATALSVGEGAIAFSTLDATTDGPAEPSACSTGGNDQYDKDLWYTYTAPCTGVATVSTCGSNFDTKVAIYSACPSASGLTLACNDDATCTTPSTQSTISFSVDAGTQYLVRVGGYAGASGTGTLTITGPSCGPTNETCAGATTLVDGVAQTGTTAGTTDDGSATCGQANNSPDVWYKYTTTTTGNVVFTTCDQQSGTYDTVLSVFTGTCAALTQIGCNDDTNGACGLRSTVTVTGGAPNTVYYVRVSGYNGASGAFTIKATGGGGVAGPSNDNCANRPGIPLGDTPFTTVNATTDGPTHAACTFFGNNNITNDVWFNYPSGCDGNLTISTCADSTFDTKIAVYDGYGCENYEPRLLACSDDNCPSNRSTVTILATAGSFYTIRVGGFNGATGTGMLNLACTPVCIADFNQDGGVDGNDVESFFVAWEAGTSTADVNVDGGVDGQDIEFFFGLWEAGGC